MPEPKPPKPKPTAFKTIPRQNGHFESFDKTRIYYELRGEGGDYIVLFPGIGSPINHWVHQVEYFSKTHRVISFDYRAHFKSSIPQDPAQISIEAICKDVYLLLQELQVPAAQLWGHSFGAQVVAHFFDTYGTKNASEHFNITHIVFINGFVSNPLDRLGTGYMAKAFEFIKQAHMAAPSTTQKLWHKLTGFKPLGLAVTGLGGGFNLMLSPLKDIEIYLKGIAHMDLDSFLVLFQNMLDCDKRHVLPQIDKPCLIIGGARDRVTPLSYQRDMHKKIPGSKLSIFPYATHCSHIDFPEYTNLCVKSFLQR